MLRESRKTRGVGLALMLTGVVLLLVAGTGLSLGHRLFEKEPAAAPAAVEEETRSDALALAAMVHVDVLGVGTSQGATLAPPVPAAVPVPSVDVSRKATLGLAPADVPVEVGADVSLQGGAALRRANAPSGEVETQKAQVVDVPLANAAVVAAAALTGAGLLAWAWTSVKAWGQKLLVLPAIALYAKISRAEVFDNDVRERIFQTVRARPGIAATDLARTVGVSWGTTIYHLDVLEQNRMVTSLREGRHRRYFENGAQLDASKETVAILQNTVTAGVAARVKTAPGVTQKDLAHSLGMSPQALHWHLTRLVAAGLVRKEREGRVVRHFAGQ